jgi:cardiolipin synthase (CMP-forming)
MNRHDFARPESGTACLSPVEPNHACADAGRLLTLPNALSFARLLLGLAFPWLPERWWPAAVVAAAVSDVLDGPLSRSTHTDSTVGRILDPIADKVFMIAVMVTLVTLGTLTVWQVVLLSLRDIAVLTRAGCVLAKQGWAGAAEVHPTWLGKVTTALQMLTLLVAVLQGEAPLVVLVPTVAVSGCAGIDYLRRALSSRGS